MPRKEPNQQRSRELVGAIYSAAERLAAAFPFERISTAKIAERAGVSVGSLYQYFANKESIFGVVVDRKVRADVDEILRVMREKSDGTLHGLTRVAVQTIVDMHARDEALYRALLPSL